MVDLIQHRYGWTDGVVFSLPFGRFQDLCELLVRIKQEDSVERYRLQAYTAYLQSGQEGMTFGDYLNALGINYESDLPKDKAMSAEQAVDHAHNILKKFSKNTE